MKQFSSLIAEQLRNNIIITNGAGENIARKER